MKKDFLKYSMHNLTYKFNNNDNEMPWVMEDEEKIFKKNLKKFPDKMQYWVENPFTYTVNKYGYRCPSFSIKKTKKRLLTVGCSHTFGQAQPENEIWPRIVADELELELYNLGVPGGSSDTVYRVINKWLKVIKPDLIIWFNAPNTLSRHEKFDNDTLYNFGPWQTNGRWHVNDRYQKFYFKKNFHAVKYLTQGIPLLRQDNWAGSQQQYARDLDHRGQLDHSLLALEILGKVKNNDYS